jgi:hypothetical protein
MTPAMTMAPASAHAIHQRTRDGDVPGSSTGRMSGKLARGAEVATGRGNDHALSRSGLATPDTPHPVPVVTRCPVKIRA